jgi:HD superfamily phosphohydrolase
VSDLPHQLDPDIAVQDAIHGRIWLTRVEREVVNTDEFQRLRRIGQLGLAQFVFPSADHSRFVHSLGATYVMGWMLRQAALQDYFSGRDELIQCLRLAALLHDVGHYPFSHLGENVWGYFDQGAAELYAGNTAEQSLYDVAAEVRKTSTTSHEVVTTKIILSTDIARIIDQRLAQVDGRPASEVVAAIIDGSYPDLVCQNLVSSDLDCDRLDYLIRDSTVAGLTYGLVDLAYLIENLVVAEHPTTHQYTLAVNKKHGSQAVEHYVLARYYHYAQCITHKTIVSAELLLAAALLELLRAGKLWDAQAVQSAAGSRDFLKLTDAYVWALLGESLSANWASSELKDASRRLHARDLLKVAYALDTLEESPSPEATRLDYILANPSRKLTVAQNSGVDARSFCYKKNELALVGIAAKFVPSVLLTDQEAIESKWVKAIKIAEPGGAPELLVEQPGLLGDLSGRRWTTRRVFVLEATPHAEKNNRPSCDALAKTLERDVGC